MAGIACCSSIQQHVSDIEPLTRCGYTDTLAIYIMFWNHVCIEHKQQEMVYNGHILIIIDISSIFTDYCADTLRLDLVDLSYFI